MVLKGNWNYPTKILFGPGRSKELFKIFKEMKINKPFFVSDKNIIKLPIIKNILVDLNLDFRKNIFIDINSNPSEQNLLEGLEKYKSGNFDKIISIGGGSVIDVGKLISFMSSQVNNVWEFEDKNDNWKKANVDFNPIIAIPTTSGTGSEVGRASVLVNSSSLKKKIIFHPKILPEIVIADPLIAAQMPKEVTSYTGLDAFIHCLEAYCCNSFHPLSDGIAIEGINLCKKFLPIAIKHPNNLEARSNMMAASIMGATSFQKGLGAIHALSHSIGGMYNTPHGLTNGILLEYVLKKNRKKIENKIINLCNYLNIENGFDGFYDFIVKFKKEINIPNSFLDIGVKNMDCHSIAENALEDPNILSNPLKLNKQDLIEIINSCT